MPDDSEVQNLITQQFTLALAGKRPIYCAKCGRPLSCRETTKFGDVFRTVVPYRHAIGSRHTRAVCAGSYSPALLVPK